MNTNVKVGMEVLRHELRVKHLVPTARRSILATKHPAATLR